ncbi:uncharacterized protein LOC124896693 [Capsicum annuum]|uniref:uncharacterized protein LOC124896693 n=1 Tax=Capsicum annuum TaxID=4072 RepID=UPI001FB0E8EB|nr:uncharacterized protein LOC124896693 [Capsicum annuum]
MCKDCKVIPSENLATQHRLLVMDLGIKKGKKRRGGEGRPRVRWGGLTPTSALEIGAKLEGMGVWEDSGDVDNVKKKVETKKATYVKLVESRDEEEKRVSMEEYKLAKKEANLAVSTAKTAAFESLGVVLGELEHTGECRDFGYCRRFKVEEVSEAIRKMRMGRVTGPDEIQVDFWKFSSVAGLRWLTNLFNNIFKSAKMPEAWR